MYLTYNEYGEIGKAFNIPVEGNYIEITPEEYDKLVLSNEKYFVKNGEITTTETEEYKEKLEKEERAKIDALTMTKRVFVLAVQQLGITYSQIKELLATNEQAQMEWDLCVNLERGNPLLDIMAEQVGVTSEQLDNIFKTLGT